ncbi:MAG: class I SAM-dependent methyltransferase [Thermoanaerobaculia bacterium]
MKTRRPFLTAIRSRIGGWIWGRRLARGGVRTWMHETVVRRYVNESVSGSPDCWPIDWLLSRLQSHRFSSALSLGCGDGPLERDLLAKGMCSAILGIDISAGALEIARRKAADLGLAGVEYRQGDLNALDLSGQTFDAVFFHQSLHHVEDLDGCLAATATALRPGGLLYLDEYVGPSRDEWSPALLAEANRVFLTLPASVRRRNRIAAPIDKHDPTEAVRSSEILPVLKRYFRIEERLDYGGNFLALIHPHLRLEPLDPAERDEVLLAIIEAEKEHLRSGAPSYYVVLLAGGGRSSRGQGEQGDGQGEQVEPSGESGNVESEQGDGETRTLDEPELPPSGLESRLTSWQHARWNSSMNGLPTSLRSWEPRRSRSSALSSMIFFREEGRA